MQRTLPTDSAERKNYPIYRGFLRYFPYAASLIAWISKRGNDKHNPGEPMHHARGKSSDHGDCVGRHIMDAEDIVAVYERGGELDREALKEELGQLGWRTCAFIQEMGEKYLDVPLAPGARLPEVRKVGKSPLLAAGYEHEIGCECIAFGQEQCPVHKKNMLEVTPTDRVTYAPDGIRHHSV